MHFLKYCLLWENVSEYISCSSLLQSPLSTTISKQMCIWVCACMCALLRYVGCTPYHTFHFISSWSVYINLLGVIVTHFFLFFCAWSIVHSKHWVRSFTSSLTFIFNMPCTRETVGSKTKPILAFVNLIKIHWKNLELINLPVKECSSGCHKKVTQTGGLTN